MQYESGIVFSLKELGERFVKFAIKSNNSTQAWEQLDDRIDTFYGATLKVPFNDSSDSLIEDTYYFICDEGITKTAGTAGMSIQQFIQTTYDDSTIILDTTMNSLSDVYNYLTALPKQEHGRFIFNGVENDLVAGRTLAQIVYDCEMIYNKSKELGLVPTLMITPNSFVYSSSSYIELYKSFVNSGYVGEKKTVVCLGDSLTDYNTFSPGYSWVNTAQIDVPNLYFINKGVDGDTTTGALSRLNADVLSLAPDVCFFLIGINDLWNASINDVPDVVNRLRSMVYSCQQNNIVPVIGLYSPTVKQLRQIISTSGITNDENTFLAIIQAYHEACEDLAKTLGVRTIEVYTSVKNGYGTITPAYIASDGFNWSVSGAEKVGHFLAKQLKEVLLYGLNTRDRSASIINCYDIFCKALDVDDLSISDVSGLLDINGKSYNETGLSYIIDYLSDRGVLQHTNSTCFYVSLQFNEIKETTYSNFINNTYQAERFIGEKSGGTLVTKWGVLNPFKNNGHILAVGLHTLYDEGLWMCEQGGITCAYESLTQDNNVNLLKVRQVNYIEGTEGEPIELPPFPSYGCPWFAMSEDDIENYRVESVGIKYWFTKDDYNATIAYKTMESNMEDVYQTMSFGKLNCVNDMSYKFPLYIAGGTEALTQDIYVYTRVSGGLPTYLSGNSYDLSLKNIGLVSCGILNPCKFNGSQSSNFRVLAPEGIWRNIFGCSQDSQVHQYYSCGVIYNWMTVLQAPESTLSPTQHTALPFMSDGSYAVDYRVSLGQEEPDKSSSFMGRIIVSFNMSIDHHENGIQGYIPNVYYICRRDMPVGEVEIDGRLFLSAPNNYESKRTYYPVSVGLAVNTGWTSEELLEKYDTDIIKTKIYDRILIPLEAGDSG